MSVNAKPDFDFDSSEYSYRENITSNVSHHDVPAESVCLLKMCKSVSESSQKPHGAISIYHGHPKRPSENKDCGTFRVLRTIAAMEANSASNENASAITARAKAAQMAGLR